MGEERVGPRARDGTGSNDRRSVRTEPRSRRLADSPQLDLTPQAILSLQQFAGNRAVADALALQRAGGKPPAKSGPPPVDARALVQQAGTELPKIRGFYLPAYRKAVDAFDAPAALELARVVVDDMARVKDACNQVRVMLAQAKATSPTLHDVEGELQLVEGQIAQLTTELAIQMGPQVFRDEPVAGAISPPESSDLGYVAKEAGTVVQLLLVVRRVEVLAGRPTATPQEIKDAAIEIEPLKSRPINILFVRRILLAKQLWSKLIKARGVGEEDLGGIVQDATDQAKATGALGDVGEFDAKKANELLSYSVTNWAITDDDAIQVFKMVMGTAVNVRAKVLAQIDSMGKLDRLCENLPWKYVEAMAKSTPDEKIRRRLEPHYVGKGGGKSLSKIYEENIMKDIGEEKWIRAYGWTFLLTAHGALTYGFLGAHDAAYDASEAGWISSDAYLSTTGKALARSAVIAAVTMATGAAGSAFGEGASTAVLGTSARALTASEYIGAGIGGATSGVAGTFVADVYDQAVMEKKGFSSGGEYLYAGIIGAASGLVGMKAQKIGANAAEALAKYTGAPQTGFLATPKTLGQMYAKRYPWLDNTLTRFRGSGVRSGLRLRVTGQELNNLVKANIVSRASLQEALDRIGAVWANDRIDISAETLAKFYPQSEIEKYYGSVDPKTGKVTLKNTNPAGGGFSGKASDVPAGAHAGDAAARQAMGLEPGTPTPGWKPPPYYQKYFNPNDPMFEVVFASDVELDVPLPDQNAPGTPLGATDPTNLHVPGTGRTAGGVAEGVLPAGAPIRIVSIRPVGTPRASYPSTGTAYQPRPPATPSVRSLSAPLGSTAAGEPKKKPGS
jgi:hypothetical protein